ncbi:hypothetical protein HYW75_03120 [Candidatus Pacearchaeota archaeon]|nr:hypothetical protein [Candidatus Pacearchaeota archaeon]
MEKIKNFLISIGLSRNEAEVYIDLCVNGLSSVLNISKRTKIHRSNIYDTIRLLMGKGLVYEIESEKRDFCARPLNSLLDYLKHKEIELNEILKEYENKITPKVGKYKIKTTKGLFSIKEALFGLLSDGGETIRVYGIPKDAPEFIGPILKEFHKERIKKKILMQQIYNSGAEERAKFLNKLKFTEARILPSKYDSFATTNICSNKIAIFLWKDELGVIEIDDENLAKPYQNYFDIMWKKAKKIV